MKHCLPNSRRKARLQNKGYSNRQKLKKLGQVDTEALPSTEDTGVTPEPEIDPRLESVLNPPEETQPDISAVEALDEAVEAAPLGVDQSSPSVDQRNHCHVLTLRWKEATDVGPKAPMIFNEEEMSLISKEENQTITRLVEFLDNNERPSQASLLKMVNNAIVGSRTAATYGRGDVSITIADKIREHFAEKLGPEGVKGPMASLFQKGRTRGLHSGSERHHPDGTREDRWSL